MEILRTLTLASLFCIVLTIRMTQAADLTGHLSFDTPSGGHCVVKPGAPGAPGITLKRVHSDAGADVGSIIFTADGDTNQTCVFSGQAAQLYGQAETIQFMFPNGANAENAHIVATLGEDGR